MAFLHVLKEIKQSVNVIGAWCELHKKKVVTKCQ